MINTPVLLANTLSYGHLLLGTPSFMHSFPIMKATPLLCLERGSKCVNQDAQPEMGQENNRLSTCVKVRNATKGGYFIVVIQ